MKKSGQRRQSKPYRPTKIKSMNESQDYVLYLRWFIQGIEYEPEDILERIPDTSQAVKHRIEAHICPYVSSASLQDDYWQVHGQCSGEQRSCPPPCHIYTTEGIHIRIDISFRTM